MSSLGCGWVVVPLGCESGHHTWFKQFLDEPQFQRTSASKLVVNIMNPKPSTRIPNR